MTEHPNLASAPDAPLDEIEWRVDGKPSGAKVRFVPYLNAATVASLLDRWVGPANWKDDYEPAAGKGLWGIVSVRVGDEWVAKKDKGVPSNFEGEKGEVSDAFKRAACLKWGVGRNVYRLPTLWGPCRVDNKGNAWPNDETLPHLTKQLKALGFDASGGTVAAYHEDANGHDVGRSEPEPAPTLAGWSSLEEQDAAHEDFRSTLAPLDEKVQAEMREFRKVRGFPWPMTSDQLDEMCEHLASLLHKPDVPAPVDDAAEKRKERARQIAEENGLPLASELEGPAKARAALKEAKQ